MGRAYVGNGFVDFSDDEAFFEDVVMVPAPAHTQETLVLRREQGRRWRARKKAKAVNG